MFSPFCVSAMRMGSSATGKDILDDCNFYDLKIRPYPLEWDHPGKLITTKPNKVE